MWQRANDLWRYPSLPIMIDLHCIIISVLDSADTFYVRVPCMYTCSTHARCTINTNLVDLDSRKVEFDRSNL